MYLKSIEIQGFKSFANKIKLDFHKGITAIVGPNGSGKSNISDAVRWVLGEQSSKSLRGSNMQDVIFAGTVIRKPQSYAFVAINLDNKDRSLNIDYDEVKISRRLFRSGESEYMINSSKVRLKDITELLYDTGIGKDGYSLIGQGQVEKILSARTEERRELFDEAIGINKFKRRKNLALKKLELEKGNLDRVRDILLELEKQVAPLERQAKKANEYLKLRDNLKSFEANLFVQREKESISQINDLNSKLSLAKNNLEDVNRDSQKINLEFDKVAREISDFDERIFKLGESINEEKISLNDALSKIEILKEQIKVDEIKINLIEKQKETLEEEKEKSKKLINENLKKLDLANKNLSKQLEKKDSELKVLDELDFKIKNISEQIEVYSNTNLENISEKSDYKVLVEREKTVLNQKNLQKNESIKQIELSKKDKEELERKIINEKELILNLEDKISQLKEDINKKESFLVEKNKLIKAIFFSINDLKIEYEKKRASYQNLLNLSERYEGYNSSIKKIMELKDRFFGIHGVVADLISLNKKYEQAIDISLGAKIQNIVVDSEENAKTLIEYLRKNKLGRATFLPLSSIKKSKDLDLLKLLNEEGVIDVASNLVTYKEEYKNIVSNLLGRVIIVKDLDVGIRISKKYNYEYRIVTLSGDQILPGGSMSGGMYKNSSNLLSRKREIEELSLECEKIEKKIINFEEEEKKEKISLTKLEADLNTDKNSLSEKLLNLNTLKTNLSTLKNNVEVLSIDLKDKEVKILDFDKEIVFIEKNIKDLETKLQSIESKLLDENDIRKKLEEDFKNLLKEKESSLLIIKEFEILEANTLKELEYLEKEIVKQKNNILDFEEKLEKENDYQSLFKNIDSKNNEISFFDEKIKDYEENILKNSKKLEEELKNKEDKNQVYKVLFNSKDEISRNLALIEKEILRLENIKEKEEERMANFTNYMWNEYELDILESKKFLFSEEKKVSNLKKEIDVLKKSIKDLGSINIDSIEEYKEVSQRYSVMKTQYDDIILSTSSLSEIVDKLEKGMRKEFREKFKLINEEFNRVFSILFSGGYARLELFDDVDILDADIKIISEPPGKKLQNMMQLSGGEKALTAIALLFAIQSLKPSPFALLDEIEAALDDSNVDRFITYLNKLSNKTQFIVITHRKGTMIKSDRLYGITMQEKGVSALVSVKLIENELK